MWPDEIPENGTIYMEIGDRKVKLLKKESVRLEIYHPFGLPKSWRKRLWTVRKGCKVLHFCNRNAAVMWLKRYGTDFTKYRLNGVLVCVLDNYVYFYNPDYGPMISAESKRTFQFAVRNN